MRANHLLKFVVDAASGSPWWAWLALIYLLFIGIKATKQRRVHLPKLFIIPTVLTALKYKVFVFGSWNVLAIYFSSLLIGVIIGLYVASRESIKILKNIITVELPGNYQTLTILMLFFSVKYVFGYLHAVHQDLATEYLGIGIGLSSLFSGYFLGKALLYVKRFLKA